LLKRRRTKSGVSFRSIIRLLYSQINIVRARAERRSLFSTNYIKYIILITRKAYNFDQKALKLYGAITALSNYLEKYYKITKETN
jgi:hypothetical protein